MFDSEDTSNIALFPLPLVLVPNEVLPLHIFEERYRRMLADVKEGDDSFGIVLYDPSTVGGSERPSAGTIGCYAEVRASTMLPDGRSNILVMGVQRFRIVQYLESLDPYHVADVEFFDDDVDDSDELTELATAVAEEFRTALEKSAGESDDEVGIDLLDSSDPEGLSFTICAALQLGNSDKYALLSSTSTSERLMKVRGYIKRMSQAFEETERIKEKAKTNGHSHKKIEF